MTTRISTSPEVAVARRSIIAQRSSRPGPPRPARVSLRRAPNPNSAATAAITAKAPAPSPGEPPIAKAANMIAPSASENSGMDQRLVIDMEDLLDGAAEVPGQSDRERERGRVALLLDGVDRLAGDAHRLAELLLGERLVGPQGPDFV